MAKRERRAIDGGREEGRVESDASPAGGEFANRIQLVVFEIGSNAFAFPMVDVGEIIRIPALAQMPLGPRSLLGVANLRGNVLPVVSLRRILNAEDRLSDNSTRVVVIGRDEPVGIVVDRVIRLLSVASDKLVSDDSGAGSINPEILAGSVKGAEGETTLKVLDPRRLLRRDFATLGVNAAAAVIAPQAPLESPPAGALQPTIVSTQKRLGLVSFELDKQEYAFPIERVREILPMPEEVSEVARSETAVLGVVTLRGELLPLVSLRTLLGMERDLDIEGKGKVVVLAMGRGAVGMVADRTREILRVDADLIDQAPSLLTAGEGDAEITSICRLDNGRRLVAILSPDRMFRADVVKRLMSDHIGEAVEAGIEADGTMSDEQFVIVRLGRQEFGLPVGAVDEIARLPAQMTRLPKAPAFVEGVMNLRGRVIPVIDLRRRFELSGDDDESQRRILVLDVAGIKAGFLVDGVSELARFPIAVIRPAPELSEQQMRLINRVANVDSEARIVPLIDPEQLLDQVEADMLAKFERTGLKNSSKTS